MVSPEAHERCSEARARRETEMMPTDHDAHDRAVIALQEKFAFLEVTVDDLNRALVAKERTITDLERRVEALENALRSLAARKGGEQEVLGAHPEEDPVPRSG